MPNRTIYVTPEVWTKAVDFANDNKRSVSEVIRAALVEYIDRHDRSSECPKREECEVK